MLVWVPASVTSFSEEDLGMAKGIWWLLLELCPAQYRWCHQCGKSTVAWHSTAELAHNQEQNLSPNNSWCWTRMNVGFLIKSLSDRKESRTQRVNLEKRLNTLLSPSPVTLVLWTNANFRSGVMALDDMGEGGPEGAIWVTSFMNSPYQLDLYLLQGKPILVYRAETSSPRNKCWTKTIVN